MQEPKARASLGETAKNCLKVPNDIIPTTPFILDLIVTALSAAPAAPSFSRRPPMFPRCRTAGEPFVIPTLDVQVRDVEGFMDE
jgi:hypothetical protein